MRRPRMSAWRNSVTGRAYPGNPRRADPAAPRGAVLPVPLPGALWLPPRDDLVGGGRLLRQDDLRDPALPLADEELAFRATLVVPAQRAEDRVDLVVTQPVRQLELTLLVDRPDPLDGRLEHLRCRVRVGRVLRDLGAAEHLLVLGDE